MADQTVIKLTWRRDQCDHECTGPRWRLVIALRRVEACDVPLSGTLGRTVFASGEVTRLSLKIEKHNNARWVVATQPLSSPSQTAQCPVPLLHKVEYPIPLPSSRTPTPSLLTHQTPSTPKHSISHTRPSQTNIARQQHNTIQSFMLSS